MNATTKAEKLAFYSAQLAEAQQYVIDKKQPNVTGHDHPLIASGLPFGDYTLDCYGEYIPGEGHIVSMVTLQGQKFDLWTLLDASKIHAIEAACDWFNDRNDKADAEFERDEMLAMQRGEY